MNLTQSDIPQTINTSHSFVTPTSSNPFSNTGNVTQDIHSAEIQVTANTTEPFVHNDTPEQVTNTNKPLVHDNTPQSGF